MQIIDFAQEIVAILQITFYFCIRKRGRSSAGLECCNDIAEVNSSNLFAPTTSKDPVFCRTLFLSEFFTFLVGPFPASFLFSARPLSPFAGGIIDGYPERIWLRAKHIRLQMGHGIVHLQHPEPAGGHCIVDGLVEHLGIYSFHDAAAALAGVRIFFHLRDTE